MGKASGTETDRKEGHFLPGQNAIDRRRNEMSYEDVPLVMPAVRRVDNKERRIAGDGRSNAEDRFGSNFACGTRAPSP